MRNPRKCAETGDPAAFCAGRRKRFEATHGCCYTSHGANSQKRGLTNLVGLFSLQNRGSGGPKPLADITTMFWDIGGVILTNGWDRVARKQAAKVFQLDWEEFQDRHDLSFPA